MTGRVEEDSERGAGLELRPNGTELEHGPLPGVEIVDHDIEVHLLGDVLARPLRCPEVVDTLEADALITGRVADLAPAVVRLRRPIEQRSVELGEATGVVAVEDERGKACDGHAGNVRTVADSSRPECVVTVRQILASRDEVRRSLVPSSIRDRVKGASMPLPGQPLRKMGFLTIGLFDEQNPAAGHEQTLRTIERAEQLGFDSVWLRNRHLQFGISSPVAVLAAATQRTSRIELGTAVIPVGWENPLRLAEDLATVDLLSGGRLNPGVSVGAPINFDAVKAALYPQTAAGHATSGRTRAGRRRQLACSPTPGRAASTSPRTSRPG